MVLRLKILISQGVEPAILYMLYSPMGHWARGPDLGLQVMAYCDGNGHTHSYTIGCWSHMPDSGP